MKTLISLILMVSSSMAFAGGSGGGGVMASAMMSTNGGGVIDTAIPSREMVYFQGEEQGTVKFYYAQLVNNHWQIQKNYIDKDELYSNPDLMAAFDSSVGEKKWVPYISF